MHSTLLTDEPISLGFRGATRFLCDRLSYPSARTSAGATSSKLPTMP